MAEDNAGKRKSHLLQNEIINVREWRMIAIDIRNDNIFTPKFPHIWQI